MKIGIDASFLRKQGTGIGQVSTNFIRKIAETSASNRKSSSGSGRASRSEKIEFVLYLEEDTDLKLPKRFSKNIFLPLWKRDDLIRKIWWEKYLLPKKIKEDGCDVFLSLYQSTTILPKKIRHIVLVHDIIPKLFPEYLNNFRKRTYQKLVEKAIARADKIVTVSHRSEKDLVQHLGIDPAKITVCYNDVDAIYKKKVTLTESKRIMRNYKLKPGYIYQGGGLEMRKNVENLLLAYKILRKDKSMKDKLPRLVISGKMMPELAPLVTDVRKLVRNLGLIKHVTLLNYVPQKDLPAIYWNALVFVYPSLYEGFGLPILEAMNQGTPVVASKNSSLPEVGSDSVLYCDPKEPEDIAMVIKNVLINDHLQAALSLKGKERAKHFSWDTFAEKMMHIMLQK